MSSCPVIDDMSRLVPTFLPENDRGKSLDAVRTIEAAVTGKTNLESIKILEFVSEASQRHVRPRSEVGQYRYGGKMDGRIMLVHG